MDSLTTAERSERMSRIGSKHTKPELAVRSVLRTLGYRYRLHGKNLPGVPDIVFPGLRKIIFVHGCFWHAHANCKVANRPKSRRRFWDAKFERNKARDRLNKRSLARDGWSVFTVWECQTKRSADLLAKRLCGFLDHRKPKGRKGK